MSKRPARQIFKDLFRTQAADLQRYLSRRVSNEEDARDLAQEAFMRILRMDRLEYIRQPEHYLLRIAANLAYEHRLKLRNARISFMADLPENTDTGLFSEEEIASNRQQVEELQKAIKTLSPNVQAALIWHRRDGLTYDEIATRLGVSGSMVKKYLQTGVAQCRTYLQGAKHEK